MGNRKLAAILLLAILSLSACRSFQQSAKDVVLIYNGVGTSKNSVREIEKLIRQCGFECVTITSTQLDKMAKKELLEHPLIVFAGGNYIEMGNGLSSETTEKLRQAVAGGTNYLGICAGGLLAGNADCNSFNLTRGVKFGFYQSVNQNIHKDVVPIVDANSHSIEHYWEDGPQFSGWGDVVGKYPDETPAVVIGSFGEGCVVLCGVHPEAPASWCKNMPFSRHPMRPMNSVSCLFRRRFPE